MDANSSMLWMSNEGNGIDLKAGGRKMNLMRRVGAIKLNLIMKRYTLCSLRLDSPFNFFASASVL